MSYVTGADEASYYSYLLRMWQVPTNEGRTWHIQLENVQTAEKLGFACLDELLAYLRQVSAQDIRTSGEGS